MPNFTLFTLSTLPTGQFTGFTAGSSFRSDITSFSGTDIVEYGTATITDTDGNPNHGQDYYFD
ncbi:MAG: type I secretion protein, partial [Paracoccaceae bacterium]|nr:type I secretion protein [Paracoccaceae bacterium]